MGDSKLKKIFCNDDIVKRLEIWGLTSAIMYIAVQFIIYLIAALVCYKDYSFQPLTPLMAAAVSTVGAAQIVPYTIAAVVMLLIKKPSRLKLVGLLIYWAVFKLFGAQITFFIAKAFNSALENFLSYTSYQYSFLISQKAAWGQFILYFLSGAVVIMLRSAAAVDFFRAGALPKNNEKLLKIMAYIAAAAVIPIVFMLLNLILTLHNIGLTLGRISGIIGYIVIIASTAAMAVIGVYCVKNNGLCKNGKNLIIAAAIVYLIRGASYFVSEIYPFLYASSFSTLIDTISSLLVAIALFAVIITGAYQINSEDKNRKGVFYE